MARMITSRPGRYTIGKLWNGRGIYRPYGRGQEPIPGPGQLNVETLTTCLTAQGWAPQRQGRALYFPALDVTLTLLQAVQCDIDHLPAPLRVDVRACLVNQGYCQ